MPEQEKEKGVAILGTETLAPAPARVLEEAGDAQHFFGESLVGFDPHDITGHLVVIEAGAGEGSSIEPVAEAHALPYVPAGEVLN